MKGSLLFALRTPLGVESIVLAQPVTTPHVLHPGIIYRLLETSGCWYVEQLKKAVTEDNRVHSATNLLNSGSIVAGLSALKCAALSVTFADQIIGNRCRLGVLVGGKKRRKKSEYILCM